jgi:tetratricopeptide (TPR) repeat protein
MKKHRPSQGRNIKEKLAQKPEGNGAGSASVLSDKLFNESRALFLTIAATILVYASSLSGSFVFDDTKQIVGNPALRSWSNVLRAFTNDVWSFERATLTTDIPPPYYRPLFTIYLTLNYQLFGLWEPGWHLMNLLVHTLATVFVYYLTRRLSRDHVVAFLTALLFGLHPVHVESVAWISGIPDPLAALFYVPSLLWYVRYREEGNRKWLAASVVAYGLAALCKETPLVLPLVLLVWELARSQTKKSLVQRFKESIPKLVPYGVVAVAYLAVRFSVLGLINWQHPLMTSMPAATIWMTAPYVFVIYLMHLVAPFYLSLIYSPPFITTAADWRFLLSVGLLLAPAYLLWTFRKKLTAQLWVAIALTVATLLPVLNLRVFHYEYIVQDRYLYLPSIGFCYLVAIAMARLARRRSSLAIALSAAIIVAFGVSTVLQNRIWHDSVALWQRAVNHSPNSRSTHYNLGLAYLGLKQYDSALTELLEARRLDPEKPGVLNNLALAQAGLGKTNEAVANLEAALALDPHSLEAHNNLGALLYDKGDYAGSKREFSLVLERDPSALSARFNLARTLAAMGDHDGAIREYNVVLEKDPNDAAARYQLGLSLAATNRKGEAVVELNRALQLDRDVGRAAEMRKKLEQIQSR